MNRTWVVVAVGVTGALFLAAGDSTESGPGPTSASVGPVGDGVGVGHDDREPDTLDVRDGGTAPTFAARGPAPWTQRVQSNQPSPVCGHRYQRPSGKGTASTVTATDHWDVRWAALGETGVIELDPTTTATLPVIELHAVTR